VSDAGGSFVEGWAMAGRRAVVASLLGVCLHVGGRGAASTVDRDPCARAAAVLRQATEALDKGQWTEAEGHLRSLQAPHASCAGVALGMARLRAAQGDNSGAERFFEQSTSLAPDDALSHALFARYWLSRGQLARADYESSRALSLDRDCPEALVVSAQISSLRGRPQEAYQSLSRAAHLSPTSAEAQYQLGVLLFRRNLHAEAVRQFEKAVALRPTDARALDYLALGLEALGEAERADGAYRRALRVNDAGPFHDSFLDYNYGRFLLKERRLEESRSHLDRALVLLPRSRGVSYERGKLNLTLGQYQAAREDAERALSLPDPAGSVLDLQVYYLLATVYARLGEAELARKYADLARTTPIPDRD
jgi:tetratricopeptide (TPR) repeat protein